MFLHAGHCKASQTMFDNLLDEDPSDQNNNITDSWSILWSRPSPSRRTAWCTCRLVSSSSSTEGRGLHLASPGGKLTAHGSSWSLLILNTFIVLMCIVLQRASLLVQVECVRCPWAAGINVVAIVLAVIFLFLLSLSLRGPYFSTRKKAGRVLQFCMGS